MPSLETEYKLAELLSTLAENERKVETNRVILAEHPAFEPYSCFKLLDRVGLGYITSKDIKDFFISRGIYCSDFEAPALIKQFDGDRDNRLNLDEFCHICLPACNSELRETAISRTGPLTVPYEVEYRLLRLFERELLLQKKLETHRRNLASSYDWAELELFKAMDMSQLSSLDSFNLQSFLRKHGFTALQDDLDAIMRRLDTDGDGSLSYVEFVEGIMPIEPICKTGVKSEIESDGRQSSSRYQSPLRKNVENDAQIRLTRLMNSVSPSMSQTSLKSPRGYSPIGSELRRTLNYDTETNDARKSLRTSYSLAGFTSNTNQKEDRSDMSGSERMASPMLSIPSSSDREMSMSGFGASPRGRNESSLDRGRIGNSQAMSMSGYGSTPKARMDTSSDRKRIARIDSSLDRGAMSMTGFGISPKARNDTSDRGRIGSSQAMSMTGFGLSPRSRNDISDRGRVGSTQARIEGSLDRGAMSMSGHGSTPKSRNDTSDRGRVGSTQIRIEGSLDRGAMSMTGFGSTPKSRNDTSDRGRVSSLQARIDSSSNRGAMSMNGLGSTPKSRNDTSDRGRVGSTQVRTEGSLDRGAMSMTGFGSTPKSRNDTSDRGRVASLQARIDSSSNRDANSITGMASSTKPRTSSTYNRLSTPLNHAMSFTEGFSNPYRAPFRSSINKPTSLASPLKSSLRNTKTSDDFGSSYRKSFGESVRFSPNLEISDVPEYSPAKVSNPHPRPMSSKSDSSFAEIELANIFKQQISLFRDLEEAKVCLASRPDFNTFDGYRLLDPQDKNYISALDLEDRLKDLGVICVQDEHILLVKHYSSHQDLRLRYYDFCDMITPKNEEYAKLLGSRSSSGASNLYDVLTSETLEKISNTFRMFLESEIVSERIRQNLESCKEFSLYDAFKAVDKDRNGYITLDEFEAVLAKQGFYATNKDLLALMEKYDKNRDGRVSYSEFVQEVTPKSPKRY